MLKKFFFLTALCFPLLLTACQSNPDPVAPPPAPIPVVTDGQSPYVIVRGDFCSDEEMNAALLLQNHLQSCGISLEIITDWEEAAPYEIVIGRTERDKEAAEKQRRYVGEEGFYVYTDAQKIYIGGGSDATVMAAVEYFLTQFFGYTGNDAAAAITTVEIPGEYSYALRQKFDLESIRVGDTDLSAFTIVCDGSADTSLSGDAETIRDMIYEKSGIWLEIASEGESPTGPYLLLAAESDGEEGMASLRQSENGLVLRADTKNGHLRLFRRFFGEHLRSAEGGTLTLDSLLPYSADLMAAVGYVEFGAVGDGVTDDFDAIIATHNYANAMGIPVRAEEGAVYYIGPGARTAQIRTDTDWSGASFIVDDSSFTGPSGGAQSDLFLINNDQKSIDILSRLPKTLTKDCRKLDLSLDGSYLIQITDSGTKRYIRNGANQNSGSAQTDLIVVDKDGNLDENALLLWDYDTITEAVAYPIPDTTLTVRGGTFTTIATTQANADAYFRRRISVNRSNVRIEGITHYIEGEGTGTMGAPYLGFLFFNRCANVEVADCRLSGHRAYKNSKGTWVGTYDILPERTVNLTFTNCVQINDILDTSLWGIMGSNYCKNLIFDGCVLSRIDAHAGVRNVTIRNTEVGHGGLSLIGAGTLLIENTTIRTANFLSLRTDYGATWEGECIIRNCTWDPAPGGTLTGQHFLIAGKSNSYHGFGYDCYMPETIVIDSLTVLDKNAPSSYRGIYLFDNMVPAWTNKTFEDSVPTLPSPFHVTKEVRISGFTSEKGKKWNISPNRFMFRNVHIVEENET